MGEHRMYWMGHHLLVAHSVCQHLCQTKRQLLSEELHFFSAMVAVMEVCQVLPYSSGGLHTLSPLTSRLSSMDSLYLVPQQCLAIHKTWCMHLGHPFRIRWSRVLWMGSHSTAPQIMLILSVEKWMYCMFWCKSMGRFLCSTWTKLPNTHIDTAQVWTHA